LAQSPNDTISTQVQALLTRPEFQTLLESILDALVIVDEQGHIVLVNHLIEDLFGYSRQELLGKSSEYLLPERFHSLQQHHRQRDLESPVTQPAGIGLELYGRRKDGGEFPVDISLSPLRTQEGLFIITMRDISERRRLEQLAHASRELLQTMLDALPSGVYLVQGKQARLVFANRAACEVWGVDWQVGQPFEDFLQAHRIHVLGSDGHELTRDDLATFRALRSGQPISQYQEVVRRPDGTTVPLLFNAVVLPAHLIQPLQSAESEAKGILVVMHDITSLKDSEQLKDEFIGMAAHELRNPLTALKGFVETLLIQSRPGRGMPLTGWQQETLGEIEIATDRLVELTEALLDVTRIQAGRLILSFASYDLVSLVRKVVQRVQEGAPQHGIGLQTKLESLVVSLDAFRIEQVLLNLLHNAVKYSPARGSITVTLEANQEQNQVVMQVQDHGIGIPAEQQPLLFQRFARAYNVQGIAGVGLGLYLCRELVERHGGRIWFESVEGQGSTFFVALPIATDTDAAPGDLRMQQPEINASMDSPFSYKRTVRESSMQMKTV
jgi:PAS domain S-box-containing protein